MDAPHLLIEMIVQYGKMLVVHSIQDHVVWVCQRDPSLTPDWVRRHILATIKKWTARQSDPQLSVSMTYLITYRGQVRFSITIFDPIAELRRSSIFHTKNLSMNVGAVPRPYSRLRLVR